MSEWTPLDLYLYTVETVGVPSRVTYDSGKREWYMEGPFSRLAPDALARVKSEASRLTAEPSDA